MILYKNMKKIWKINKLLNDRSEFLRFSLLYTPEKIKKDKTIIFLNNYLDKLNKDIN